MNIHEYQSKAVLKSFGAPVSEGQPALTVEEAVAAAKTLPLVTQRARIAGLYSTQLPPYGQFQHRSGNFVLGSRRFPS